MTYSNRFENGQASATSAYIARARLYAILRVDRRNVPAYRLVRQVDVSPSFMLGVAATAFRTNDWTLFKKLRKPRYRLVRRR